MGRFKHSEFLMSTSLNHYHFLAASARTISSIASSFLWPSEDTSVQPCGLLPFRTTPDGTQRNILYDAEIVTDCADARK